MASDPAQRDAATLLDIDAAAQRIAEFITGVTLAQFETDAKTQSAVLHQLMVIGEAAKRISAPFRAAHPSIPFARMAGMRDRLIHAYDDVQLPLVWRAATVEAPTLRATLQPLLPTPQ